jgi:hypothetical protein
MISRISQSRELEETFRSENSVMEERCAEQGRPAGIMRKIYRSGHFKPVAGFWSVVENLVWGLSPGSSILLLALTILCVRMYLNLGHEYLSAAAAYLESSTGTSLHDAWMF